MSDHVIKTIVLNFDREGFTEEADKAVARYVDEMNAIMKHSNHSNVEVLAAQVALELMARQGRSMRDLVGVDAELFEAALQRYWLGLRR